MSLTDAPLGLFYGTRPQTVKAARLVEVLGSRWPLITVDTGQHYDYELNGVLYEQLGVRPPDLFLDVGSGDHASQTAAVMIRCAEVLRTRRPWAVVVIGDTNSTLGCALAAAKQRIPVVHVEAGLRAADLMMAEEINRRVVDSISALLCAPSDVAEALLRREHQPGRIVRTGDVARDVLESNVDRAGRAASISGWPLPAGTPFAFATLHRAELVDAPLRFVNVLDALTQLPVPVVLAAHPRTQAALAACAPSAGAHEGKLHVLPALSYLDAVAATRDAAVIVTDSGGVQRESYWLGRPCVTLRTETEWTETIELGANTLVAPDLARERLCGVVQDRLAAPNDWSRDAYGRGDAASLIADALTRWRAECSPEVAPRRFQERP